MSSFNSFKNIQIINLTGKYPNYFLQDLSINRSLRCCDLSYGQNLLNVLKTPFLTRPSLDLTILDNFHPTSNLAFWGQIVERVGIVQLQRAGTWKKLTQSLESVKIWWGVSNCDLILAGWSDSGMFGFLDLENYHLQLLIGQHSKIVRRQRF